jgi:hypothetical protein
MPVKGESRGQGLNPVKGGFPRHRQFLIAHSHYIQCVHLLILRHIGSLFMLLFYSTANNMQGLFRKNFKKMSDSFPPVDRKADFTHNIGPGVTMKKITLLLIFMAIAVFGVSAQTAKGQALKKQAQDIIYADKPVDAVMALSAADLK